MSREASQLHGMRCWKGSIGHNFGQRGWSVIWFKLRCWRGDRERLWAERLVSHIMSDV